MNFTFDNTTGTPQQIAWVQQAIQACTYPLDELSVPVTVTWGAVPCGLLHTYMCTEWFYLAEDPSDVSSYRFIITIEPWADDPNAIENRGLPNPGADIQTFYMQSFVHELGHVIHRTLINTDDLRTQAAGLFWTPSVNASSGRRAGQLQDYSPDETTGLGWACSVVEAIAESVKCAWYQGRLIYMNRTNWRIDEQEWPTLVKLLTPSVGPGGSFDETWRAFNPAKYAYVHAFREGQVVPEGHDPSDSEWCGYQPTDFAF